MLARAHSDLTTSRAIARKKPRALREGTAYLIATQRADRALSAGCRAPGFCLPDQDGTAVSWEVLARSGPIVLTFYSGTWCSLCMRDLTLWNVCGQQLKLTAS